MVSVERLRQNTVLLSLSFSTLGNRKKAVVDLPEGVSPDRISVSKKLLDSEEYQNIVKFFADVRAWVIKRTVPSLFREGMYLISLNKVDEVEKYLRESVNTLRDLVSLLQEEYPARVEEAKQELGPLFSERDYPPVQNLPSYFSIRWYWVTLSTAEELPPEIRESESQKLKKMWEDSISEIQVALRTGLQNMINHAIDKLSPSPDGKRKVIRDTFVDNFNEFLESLTAKNVIEDKELEKLVKKARDVMSGVTSDELRKDQDLKNEVAQKLEELKAKVDAAVANAPVRKFKL